jgi:hypothetical protein
MHQPEYPENATEGRGIFRRSPSDQPEQPSPSTTDPVARMVDERLEEGLRGIEEQAGALMREIASEMWRSASGDVKNEQDRIISFLSRDQAIRSLIMSSDERFQALAVRTARLEDTLTDLAESSRAMRNAMVESAQAISDTANSPALHGVETIRDQLEQVERHIAEALSLLNDRDRALVEGIQLEIKEHGDMVMHETTRIVEAMQGYVQGGVEAMGMLAQRVEAHMNTVAVHDDDINERLRGTIERELAGFAELLTMVHDRVGINGREIQHMTAGLRSQMDQRVMGLAQLVRSDSQALHRAVNDAAASQDSAVREIIAENLSGMAAQTREALLLQGSETNRRLEQVSGLVEERMNGVSDELSSAVDRQMARLADLLDVKLSTLGESIAARAAEATGSSLASSLSETMERMTAATQQIEEHTLGASEERAATEERMIAHLDERTTTIARLIRADNKVLADQVAAATGDGGSENAKQTLRTVKELQAGLTADFSSGMDQRFQTMAERMHRETQSTAETMAKVAEILAEKMDRLTVKIDDVYGNDLQVVIERMAEAVHEMSRRQPS